jgi:hypothetical protein
MVWESSLIQHTDSCKLHQSMHCTFSGKRSEGAEGGPYRSGMARAAAPDQQLSNALYSRIALLPSTNTENARLAQSVERESPASLEVWRRKFGGSPRKGRG